MKKKVKSLNDLRKDLKRAAWRDDIPDDLRPLLESASRTLAVTARRLLRMAQWCEAVEGYSEELEATNVELEALVNHLGGVPENEEEGK